MATRKGRDIFGSGTLPPMQILLHKPVRIAGGLHEDEFSRHADPGLIWVRGTNNRGQPSGDAARLLKMGPNIATFPDGRSWAQRNQAPRTLTTEDDSAGALIGE